MGAGEIRQAGQLIEEWNEKLGAGFAELKPAAEVDFRN